MVIDLNGTLLAALELVYEQSRPEVRGLWRERIDKHLRIQTGTRPDLGDWVRPWLELVADPTAYLSRGAMLRTPRGGTEQAGSLHDRPRRRLASLDRADVDRIVMHPESFTGPVAAMDDVDLAAGLLAGYNRYLGTYCDTDSARLTGAIQLHALQQEWSLLELRRLAERPWVAGASIALPSRVPISDPSLGPLLNAIADHDLPLFHRTEMLDAPHFPGSNDLWSQPLLAAALGAAWDAQRFLTALICGRVLQAHPTLRICILDGGVGWLPGWIDQLSGVDVEIGDLARDMLGSGRVVVVVAPHDSETSVKAAMQVLGDRCIAWGSAFPRAADVGPVRVRQWLDIPAERHDHILHQNAERLLRRAQPVAQVGTRRNDDQHYARLRD